ncbi:hypothetical protein KAU30_00160 [Candidatus Bathyarchaeota archaeon]|nr:hypothetical protein [Candidatus Bathyarchaeota archaeon]
MNDKPRVRSKAEILAEQRRLAEDTFKIKVEMEQSKRRWNKINKSLVDTRICLDDSFELIEMHAEQLKNWKSLAEKQQKLIEQLMKELQKRKKKLGKITVKV